VDPLAEVCYLDPEADAEGMRELGGGLLLAPHPGRQGSLLQWCVAAGAPPGYLVRLIPVAARYLLRRRLYGKDINKKGLLEGEVTALVTSTISITCSALCVFRSILCFMILLGFIDDVLDIPWRVYVLSHSVIHFIPIESLSCF
jgi:hypothetical protein